jgi:hypothetical protein
MYQRNPEFEEPEDTAIIWRYVDFTKFISYLEKKKHYFLFEAINYLINMKGNLLKQIQKYGKKN